MKWIRGNTKVFVGGNNFLEMWKDDGNEIVQYYTNMLKKYLLSKYSKSFFIQLILRIIVIRKL